MPKVTITIEADFKGEADVEMQKPLAFMLEHHARYLTENAVKPQGEQEFQVFNAVLKWKVERVKQVPLPVMTKIFIALRCLLKWLRVGRYK